MNENEDVPTGKYGKIEQILIRLQPALARVEKVYLGVLRISALLVATLLLIYVLWLLLVSSYNVSRDPESVTTEPVAVSGEEIIEIDMRRGQASPGDDSRSEAKDGKSRSPFDKLADDYYSLFQKKFETYKQPGDSTIAREDFVDRYLAGFERAEESPEESEFSGTDLEFDDRVDLISIVDFSGLLEAMTTASSLPVTTERLEKYRDTKKIEVEDQVQRTRIERVCDYYSYYLEECLTYDTRRIPYTETVKRLEPPPGVLDHQELFEAYQSKYLSELYSRRQASTDKANRERDERREANERGWLGFSEAGRILVGFLLIMFFFLLIAIERHQRSIASKLN